VARLTKRQQKTVLKHRRMAYWYVKRNPSLIAEYGLKDANQHAMVILCDSAIGHDPKHVGKVSGKTAQFTTYLYMKLHRGFIDLARANKLRIVTMANDDLAHMVEHGSIERIQDPTTIIDTEVTSRIEAEEQSQLTESLLSIAGERERRVLELRFGFTNGHCHTLKEIGHYIGVTKERVRQLQERGLRHIRRHVEDLKSQSPSGEWP